MALPDGSASLDLPQEFTWPSGLDYDLVFRWISLDRLSDLRLYPTFLRTMLPDPPSSPVHVVQTGDHWVHLSA